MVRFLVSVPGDLHQALKVQANARGQTLAGLIRQILWDWSDSQNKDLMDPPKG